MVCQVSDRKRKPREITLPPRTYQPSRAELREEFDMPGASMETVRKAFFRPFKVKIAKLKR